MNNLVVLLSYADTIQKQQILKRGIENLKRFGYDILVSDHIPIPQDIAALCDYVLIDKDNPVIWPDQYQACNIFYIFGFDESGYRFTHEYVNNTGFAVWRLIRNAAILANGVGYTKALFLNYDFVVTSNHDLPTNFVSLDTFDAVMYDYAGEESMASNIFYMRPQYASQLFTSIQTLGEYLNNGSIHSMLEYVLCHRVKRSGAAIKLRHQHEISEGGIERDLVVSERMAFKGVIANERYSFNFLRHGADDTLFALRQKTGSAQYAITINNNTQGIIEVHEGGYIVFAVPRKEQYEVKINEENYTIVLKDWHFRYNTIGFL